MTSTIIELRPTKSLTTRFGEYLAFLFNAWLAMAAYNTVTEHFSL